MALQKEIVLATGVVSNYHKIKSFNVNFMNGTTIIVVDSYVSKKIREKENVLSQIVDNINLLESKKQAAIETNDVQLEQSLHDKLDLLKEEMTKESIKIHFVHSSTIILNSIPETLSMSNIYNLLKKTDMFSGAKKV